MSDAIQAAAQGTPAPSAPAPTPPAAQPIGISSAQLQERLAEERAKGLREGQSAILTSLGFAKEDDAKAVLAAAKALQQQGLSEQEKSAARIKELEPLAVRVPVLEGRIKALADREFAALPPATQAAIDKQAHGNPERRLELIDVFRDAGLVPIAGSQPAPLAAPITTSPPANAPPPSNVRTKFDEWSELNRDPARGIHAALFYQGNRAEIERTRPAGQ